MTKSTNKLDEILKAFREVACDFADDSGIDSQLGKEWAKLASGYDGSKYDFTKDWQEELLKLAHQAIEALIDQERRIAYERGMEHLLNRMEVDMDELKLNPSGWVLKRSEEIKAAYFDRIAVLEGQHHGDSKVTP